MGRLLFLPILLTCVVGICAQNNAAQAEDVEIDRVDTNSSVIVLVPISEADSWHDDAFLMAVPAATIWGDGEPIVLAVDGELPFRPEVLDFISRFQPDRMFWLGPTLPDYTAPGIARLEHIRASSRQEAAQAIMDIGWPDGSKRAVLFDHKDSEAALLASALAARLGEPVVPFTGPKLDEVEIGLLRRLGSDKVIVVGASKPASLDGIKVEHLKSETHVVRWLVKNDHPVEYLAATNVRDTAAGRDRNLALAAVLLAAGREGVIVPFDFDTIWKKRFDAEVESSSKPNGAADSGKGWRRGLIEVEGTKATPFVIGSDMQTGRWWLQVDRNRNGRFSGAKEQPLFTGDELEFADASWNVDLDVEEATRGQAVWLTSPTVTEISSVIQDFHAVAKQQPRYLCLVGWPDALPTAIVSHGQGIDADLASDLPYTQLDEDPFFELAHARFIAEDLESATLLACRGFARDSFPERGWENSFATAEWEETCRDPLVAAGCEFNGHHEGGTSFGPDSPLTEVGLIVHASHAMWTVMGETYAWNTDTLLAPALVESAGCSTASLDQDGEHRSVASRLLKNGAVAFVGNSRRGIAEQELFRSEFWNALLDGHSIGSAQRQANNRVMFAVLEKGQTDGGPYFYQLYNQMVFGDPALQLGLKHDDAEQPAVAVQDGNEVIVKAPPKWHRSEYVPLGEWGCEFPKLWAWRGAGVGVESTWHGPQKRNEEQLLFNVEVRTNKKFSSVEARGDVPPNLGWTGSCFVDHHLDGSRSLYWRVRFIDGDKTTGELRAQVDELKFKLSR